MAALLARNIPLIARHPDAGGFHGDLKRMIGRIENKINRPPPPRRFGPCPSQLDTDHDNECMQHHPHACATELIAPRHATEVWCPTCRRTHDPKYLTELLHHYLRYHPLSAVEILGSRTSDIPGALEHLEIAVPRSTFYYWTKKGFLKPRAYRDADNSVRDFRLSNDDLPLYWIGDVEKLLETHDKLA